jgi:hypothetical protein
MSKAKSSDSSLLHDVALCLLHRVAGCLLATSLDATKRHLKRSKRVARACWCSEKSALKHPNGYRSFDTVISRALGKVNELTNEPTNERHLRLQTHCVRVNQSVCQPKGDGAVTSLEDDADGSSGNHARFGFRIVSST